MLTRVTSTGRALLRKEVEVDKDWVGPVPLHCSNLIRLSYAVICLASVKISYLCKINGVHGDFK